MNKKKISLLFLLFSLVSCSHIGINSSNSSINNSSESTSFSSSSNNVTSLNSSSSTSSSSIENSSIQENNPVIEDKFVDLYAINDFHGSVNENGNERGILKVGTYLKQKRKQDNTLVLSSGDMWQGSIESNYNRGELLTYVMNNVGFDCFTLGNHEFDWGGKYIEKNRNLKDEKTQYQTPFLAANIYNYDPITKNVLLHADNLGDQYTIRELENGLKVGIIGVIGENQLTSITSQYVDNYTFIDTTTVIKNLSDELKKDKKCDIVIVDAHASSSQMSSEITYVSSVTNKRYVDAVFCAHSHKYEDKIINNVPFIQAGSNGYSASYVRLKYGVDGVISCETRTNDLKEELYDVSQYDSEIQDLVNKYNEASSATADEVLGSIDGYLGASCSGNYTIPNLVVTALADYAIINKLDVDLTMCNQARAPLNNGNITYRDLFKSLPFDNVIYILECDGKDILYEAKYNSLYRISNDAIVSGTKYKIAVLDYLAFHKNTDRELDYFPTGKVVGHYEKIGEEIYNYRDITADYIRSKKTLNQADYSNSNSRLNRNNLSSSL